MATSNLKFTVEKFNNSENYIFKYFIGGLDSETAFQDKGDCQKVVDALNLAEDFRKIRRKADTLHNNLSSFLDKWE